MREAFACRKLSKGARPAVLGALCRVARGRTGEAELLSRTDTCVRSLLRIPPLRFRHWEIRPSQDPDRIQQISPGKPTSGNSIVKQPQHCRHLDSCVTPYRVPPVRHCSFPGFHPGLVCLILSGSRILGCSARHLRKSSHTRGLNRRPRLMAVPFWTELC